MQPESERVLQDFPAWEHFRQNIGTHLVRGAVQKRHLSALNSVTDEVVAYVDVLGTRVVVVDVSEANRSLIITKQGSGRCKVKVEVTY